MKGYLKMSQLLGGCLGILLPLWLQAQVLPPPAMGNVRGPIPPAPAVMPVNTPTDIIPLAPPMGPVPPVAPVLPPDLNRVSSVPPGPPLPMDRIGEILDFWFGVVPGPDFFPEDKMPIWFATTPEVEMQIRNNFAQDVINAGRGEYNNWRETPRGRLALILLLDQVTRHIYRNKPQAFAFDRMAQALAVEGIQKGDDKALYPVERAFFYLPLEHAEDLDLQNLSVASYGQLARDVPGSLKPEMRDFLQAAMTHQQQIARFGRFPYRNAILGRESTPEETVFLMQWGMR